MDALRKTYHRAVQIPLENVERLWSKLATFENNLNSITAKKLLSDLSPAYTKARAVLTPLANHLHALYPPSQNLFLPLLPTFDAADRSLVGKWKVYLKWEESNPLETEDKETLIRRVQGVYRKAVVRMRFYPEIWYMAYNWSSNGEKPDDALLILKAGIDANPTRCVHLPLCASASHPE
jgi:cleavage stimulation factor subunit 3